MNSSQGSTSSAILSQAILIKEEKKERKGKAKRNASKGVNLSRASHSFRGEETLHMSVNPANASQHSHAETSRSFFIAEVHNHLAPIDH